MLDIDREIMMSYGLEYKSVLPYKDAYIINTNRGKKLLRKTSLSGERIQFIHAVKEHMNANNFKYTDRYDCTIQGMPYVTAGDSNFTLCDVLEGKECNFDSRDDIVKAARVLAEMHKASKGFTAPQNCIPRDDLGKLPAYFRKRLDELKKLRKVARKGKTKFDYMFMDCFDYYYSLGEAALRELESSNYDKVVEEAKKTGIICHHDFTHHNLVNSDSKLYIINFEFCCFELKVYDVANLLRRKMRKCSWAVDEAKVIMDEYTKVEEISQDELLIMKLILMFPQKLWRVVNKYYNSNRSWSEKSFISKMQEVIDEREGHGRFLEKYELLV